MKRFKKLKHKVIAATLYMAVLITARNEKEQKEIIFGIDNETLMPENKEIKTQTSKAEK